MIIFDGNLWLFTPEEFEQLPDGIVLECINGDYAKKGVDYIDGDTRFGYMAYGVRDPYTHPEAELFTKFMLSK